MPHLPWLVPVFAPGKEPLPPGWTEDDRKQMKEQKKYQDWMTMGMESCAAKTVIAGGGGEFESHCHISQPWDAFLEVCIL